MSTENALQGWLTSAVMDAAADYVARGRWGENIAAVDLLASYRATWGALALAPPQPAELIRKAQDIEAELGLRQLPIPALLDERAAVVRAWTALAEVDPDRWSRTTATVQHNIAAALRPEGERH